MSCVASAHAVLPSRRFSWLIAYVCGPCARMIVHVNANANHVCARSCATGRLRGSRPTKTLGSTRRFLLTFYLEVLECNTPLEAHSRAHSRARTFSSSEKRQTRPNVLKSSSEISENCKNPAGKVIQHGRVCVCAGFIAFKL